MITSLLQTQPFITTLLLDNNTSLRLFRRSYAKPYGVGFAMKSVIDGINPTRSDEVAKAMKSSLSAKVK